MATPAVAAVTFDAAGLSQTATAEATGVTTSADSSSLSPASPGSLFDYVSTFAHNGQTFSYNVNASTNGWGSVNVLTADQGNFSFDYSLLAATGLYADLYSGTNAYSLARIGFAASYQFTVTGSAVFDLFHNVHSFAGGTGAQIGSRIFLGSLIGPSTNFSMFFGPTDIDNSQYALGPGTYTFSIASTTPNSNFVIRSEDGFSGQSNPRGYFEFNIRQAVPEPSSWAMMIGGFALMGLAMRRRKAMQVNFA